MTRHDRTLVERLAELEPDGAAQRLWQGGARMRRLAEAQYRRLLHPVDPGPVTLTERRAIAAFVAAFLGEPAVRDHLLALLRDTLPTTAELSRLIAAEADAAPRPDPHSSSSRAGWAAPVSGAGAFRLGEPARRRLGARLGAGLELAHRLALAPSRDRTALAAEWSGEDAALLAEIVAMVVFLSHLVAGLRAASVVAAGRLSRVA